MGIYGKVHIESHKNLIVNETYLQYVIDPNLDRLTFKLFLDVENQQSGDFTLNFSLTPPSSDIPVIKESITFSQFQNGGNLISS